MRTAFLMILLAVSPFASAVDDSAVSIEFDEPFSVWGEPGLSTNGKTTIAAFSDAGTIRLWVSKGTHVIENRNIQIALDGTINSGDYAYPQQSEYVIEESGWITVTPLDSRELAFMLQATGVQVGSWPGFYATTWNDDDQFRRTEFGKQFGDLYHNIQAPWPRNETGVLIRPEGNQLLQLKSTTMHWVTWAGGSVTCEEVSPCPTSDQGDAEPQSELGTRNTVNVLIEAPAIFEVDFHDADAKLLAPNWSVSGPIAARLPRADGPDCRAAGCNGDKTIRLQGDFRIEEIRRVSDGRFSGQVQGSIERLTLDEVAKDPSLLWTAGVAATAGAAAIATAIMLKLGLFGLFTRISADEALEHPRRQRIFAYIVDHPGATFREIVRNTDIPAGTTRHHLNVMRRSELVVEKPHKSTLRFFENHGKFDASWDTVVMLREEPLKEVHDWLREHPESPQKTIISAMETKGHSRGTTQHRLTRLVDAGLVTFRQQGRLKLYTAHDEPQTTGTNQQFQWNGLDASWPRPNY